MAIEKREHSSWWVVLLYVFCISMFTVEQVLQPLTSWSVFVFGVGWALALFTLILCGTFASPLKAYPWFYNTVAVSDIRIMALAEVLGFSGSFLAVLLNPSGWPADLIVGLLCGVLLVPALWFHAISPFRA